MLPLRSVDIKAKGSEIILLANKFEIDRYFEKTVICLKK